MLRPHHTSSTSCRPTASSGLGVAKLPWAATSTVAPVGTRAVPGPKAQAGQEARLTGPQRPGGHRARADWKGPHGPQPPEGPRARRAQLVSQPSQAGHACWTVPSQRGEGRVCLRPSPATRPAVSWGRGRGTGGQGVYLSSLRNWGWASAISRLLLNIALLQQEQSEKTELLTLPLQAVWKARPPRSSSWRGPPGPGPGHDLEGKSHRMEPRPQCTLHGALLGRAAWPGRGGCPAPTAILAPPQRVACCGPSSSDYA